jgi:hypothetical protein
LIEPHYPKTGNGRPPVGLGIMLRVYFLQHWFNLSDPGVEDALYESPALVMQIERAEWRPTLAGCKVIIHQHLDATLTLMIAGHRVGHYSAEGKLLTPLTKKQVKAVEKTLRGKVQKQTFPLNLQIPQTTRDSHFPTASTATNL